MMSLNKHDGTNGRHGKGYSSTQTDHDSGRWQYKPRVIVIVSLTDFIQTALQVNSQMIYSSDYSLDRTSINGGICLVSDQLMNLFIFLITILFFLHESKNGKVLNDSVKFISKIFSYRESNATNGPKVH